MELQIYNSTYIEIDEIIEVDSSVDIGKLVKRMRRLKKIEEENNKLGLAAYYIIIHLNLVYYYR